MAKWNLVSWWWLCVCLVVQVSLTSDENPIKHVVAIMMENRSFDHLLGYLKKLNAEVDGLNGDEFNYYDPHNEHLGKETVSFDAPWVF